MRTEIIEILQRKYPEYCMQHIDTADEILRLFSVSNNEERVPFCDKHKEEMTYDTNVNEHFCWTCEHGGK